MLSFAPSPVCALEPLDLEQDYISESEKLLMRLKNIFMRKLMVRYTVAAERRYPRTIRFMFCTFSKTLMNII
jgi:hypothetical protein